MHKLTHTRYGVTNWLAVKIKLGLWNKVGWLSSLGGWRRDGDAAALRYRESHISKIDTFYSTEITLASNLLCVIEKRPIIKYCKHEIIQKDKLQTNYFLLQEDRIFISIWLKLNLHSFLQHNVIMIQQLIYCSLCKYTFYKTTLSI